MGERVCSKSNVFAILGMVIVGFVTIMLGVVLCIVEFNLGVAIAMIGLLMLAGSTLVSMGVAMSKPEALIERSEIDWRYTEWS